MSADDDSERRGSNRKFRRLSCEIEFEGKVHSAVIRDLAPQGLFVVTRFEAAQGTPVTVRIRRPGGAIWEIAAVTARTSDGSGALISGRGMGLMIDEAPAGFHEFFESLRG
jgi:hypothetical protein